MNITDILFINGQVNWVAINTISNIILVGALVYVTCRHANQFKKQTESLEKDREKNKVLEGIRYVLIPSMYKLTDEIEAIKNGKRKIHFGQFFNVFLDKKLNYRYAFWGMLDKFTNLPKQFHFNDESADKLNILYTKIGDAVTAEFESNKFDESLTNMINFFYPQKRNVFGTNNEALCHLKNLCKECIVSDWDLSNNVPQLTEHENNFLKENKKELQKYMELQKIKEFSKEIKDKINALKKSDEGILEVFEEIKTTYREDYGFSDGEMDSSIKEEINFLKK